MYDPRRPEIFELDRATVPRPAAGVGLRPERDLAITCSATKAAAARPAPAPAWPAAVEGEQPGGVVLVVEDERAIRELARRMLDRHGYTVLTAADGSEATRLAREHEGAIDLLLTDALMPGMQGGEVAERVRTIRPEIRTVYMSGYVRSLLGASQGLPPDAIVVQKPFSEQALLTKVAQALEPPPID